MAGVDAAIKGAQFRILSNGDPGALNQLVAQTAIARARDLAAILFVTGRMLARYQAEKSSNLPHVGNQSWIAKASDQVSGYDLADAGQALEPGDRLSQFRILFTVMVQLLLRRRGRVEIEMQRAHELVQLK